MILSKKKNEGGKSVKQFIVSYTIVFEIINMNQANTGIVKLSGILDASHFVVINADIQEYQLL